MSPIYKKKEQYVKKKNHNEILSSLRRAPARQKNYFEIEGLM